MVGVATCTAIEAQVSGTLGVAHMHGVYINRANKIYYIVPFQTEEACIYYIRHLRLKQKKSASTTSMYDGYIYISNYIYYICPDPVWKPMGRGIGERLRGCLELGGTRKRIIIYIYIYIYTYKYV